MLQAVTDLKIRAFSKRELNRNCRETIALLLDTLIENYQNADNFLIALSYANLSRELGAYMRAREILTIEQERAIGSMLVKE